MPSITYLGRPLLGRCGIGSLWEDVMSWRNRGRLAAIPGPVRTRLGVQATTVRVGMLHVLGRWCIGRVLAMCRIGGTGRRDGRIYRHIVVRPGLVGFVMIADAIIL